MIVTNATLQWIPEQLDLLPGFVRALRPGGWLAIQIPGNGNAPSHAILRELAGTEPYAEYAKDASLRPDVPGPAEYVDALSAEGCVGRRVGDDVLPPAVRATTPYWSG